MVQVRLTVWVVAQAWSLVGLASLWVAEAPLQVVVASLVVVGVYKLFAESK
jgi:hypothetical protein